MKNSYLFLKLCFLVCCTVAYSQDAYVTGNQKVKVMPNTLVYFGGDLNLTSGATNDFVLENAGNVMIMGNFTNAGDTSDNGANFVSTWTNNNTQGGYGQVIINEGSTAEDLAMEKGKLNPATLDWGQFAVPFNFTSANAAMVALFGGPYVNGTGMYARYRNSMMVWDNTNKPEFDHLNSSSAISSSKYIILNLVYDTSGIKLFMGDGTGKAQYHGKPSNGVHSESWATSSYPTSDWNVWKNLKNSHNERYSTYIVDQVRTATDVDYGRHHYQFGNPYTSNITLAYLGSTAGQDGPNDDGNKIDNLVAVTQYGAVDWDIANGVTSASSVTATYNSGTNQWAGKASALIAKPFEPFVIVLDAPVASTGSINFSDKMKTFKMPGTDGTPIILPLTGKNASNGQADLGQGDIDGKVGAPVRPRFYQVELTLHNNDDTPTTNRVYVAVTSTVQDGVPNNLESEYADFGSRTGFYLGQENADGSPVNTTSRKMQINTVNINYVSKPIQLFFKRNGNDTNGYNLKANLFYRDIFTEVLPEQGNFIDGNSFFFYDKVEDVLLPITTDFNYYVEISENAVENRYQVYWNGGPVSGKGGNVEETTDALASTSIYKDENLHKVRFNENWTTADLNVYDMSGRNIMTFTGIDTKSDFALNLPKAGVYVVKIESNTGEVYTQKVIK